MRTRIVIEVVVKVRSDLDDPQSKEVLTKKQIEFTTDQEARPTLEGVRDLLSFMWKGVVTQLDQELGDNKFQSLEERHQLMLREMGW